MGVDRPTAVVLYIAMILAASVVPAASLYEEGGASEYTLNGSVVVYLEGTRPIIYLYINYSTGPGSLLVDLPVEPYGDNIEIVGGSAISAVYMGYLYSLVLVNSSEGSIVLRYRGGYSYEGGARVLEIWNTSWSSYIEIVTRKGVELSGVPVGAIQYSEGDHVRYRIAYIDGLILIAIEPKDYNAGLEVIGLLLSTTAVGFAATYYAIKTHKRRSLSPGRVDAIDREILRVIRDLGGEAPASKIQELTGLPKTTLWRRLRKLERTGYIEIYRVGRGSIARLAGRPTRV